MNSTNHDITDCEIDEQKIFTDPNEFSMYIETVASNSGQSCLDTLVDYIESKSIDIEHLNQLISPSLKSKLFTDFVDRGMITVRNTLTDFYQNDR